MKTYEILILAGLAGLTLSAWLLAGWWLAVLIASAALLGLGFALAQEPEPVSAEPADGLDALITASPTSPGSDD